jgi:transketolase
MNNIEQKSINTIRILSAEMVERAKSGHPVCLWGQRRWRIPFGPGR